jgi:uncharacterized membrane protein YkoI
MFTVHRFSSFTGLGLIVVAGALLVTSAHRLLRAADDHDEKVEMSKVPAAVQAAAKKILPNLDACKASMETENGDTYFEIEGKGENSMSVAVILTSSGQIIEVEREVPADRLPAAARAGIEKSHPGATVARVEDVEKHHFEVKVVGKDGKAAHVDVSVTGRVGGDEEDEDDEGREEKH